MSVEPVSASNPEDFFAFALNHQFRSHYESQSDATISGGPSEGPTQAKRRALIVDDVPDVTEMLSVLLSHADYDVVTAESAARALAFAREQHFDLVISDIGMPEMNGYQMVQIMRSVPGYESVPMVAVTGYSMFNDREKSLAAGFNAHMTKPVDPRALLDLIEQL